MKKLLVIQVAALGQELVTRHPAAFARLGLEFRPLEPVFPAVTCPVQASFRTGVPPDQHGILANGFFDRATRRTAFWEQASAQITTPVRIWDEYRKRGGRVGIMFWQQSLGEDVELILSPAPIHKHHGGMIQDCYAQPANLYSDLRAEVGRGFNLMHYWGPLAGVKSTRWITDATLAVLKRADAPGLLLTYLPHLDYALQRFGPQDEKRTAQAVAELVTELEKLLAGAKAAGYEAVVFGDYAITPATQVIFPNRELRKAGFLQVRKVGKMAYPDLYASRAFALVDHQAAHVFVRSPQDVEPVRALLAALPGVAEVRETQKAEGRRQKGELGNSKLETWETNESDSPCSSVTVRDRPCEITLSAAPGAWFAYPWWEEKSEAPEYASHVDIHAKPGFDPCELFWGWPPMSIGQNPAKVGGTHGRTDAPAAWAATAKLPCKVRTLLDLSEAVRLRLEAEASL